MKKNLLSLVLIFLCIQVAFPQTVLQNYQDGKVYVKFTKVSLKSIAKENPRNIPLSKLDFLTKIVTKYNVTKANIPFYQANDDEHLPYILKLEFNDITKVNELITELSAMANVDYAEKVSIMKVDATTPNDFSISTASVHLTQINALNAWDYFNGNSNITVAVVDNAVMWNHADLAANIYTNTVEFTGVAGVDDDGNGYIDDINGWDAADNTNDASHPLTTNLFHGTHCAGIAGARTDNAIGVASIGWNLKIIPVQCESDGSPSPTAVTYGYEGILYAVKAKARIISCSWGNQVGSSQTEQYVIDYAWNRGCIIIASAGNNGTTTPNYPGAYNHVYCVAAVDASDVVWGSSNRGTWVDISAPGTNILSTMPYTSAPAYNPLNGTSMATPMVAGLAGLMLSKSPNMTRTDVLNCISNTAVNIYTLAGNSGVLGNMGAGRIDAHAAMVCASTYSALPPVANFYAFLPNTCPNTPIPFVDSSLYNPTSWSWIFQGGTPATSTSSNPSVQWSTPGVYSVSLTVTNGSGSHTKIKLAYVTVAGPTALPFYEGFQASQFLPTNWVANNIWNDNLYWERVTGVGGFGTSTACAVFNNFDINAPGERDEMRTPKFDFSNVASVRLRFDVAYSPYGVPNSDTLEVKASIDCGTTWTSIYTKGGTNLATAPSQGGFFTPTSTQWRRDTIDVSVLAAGHTNVMFSFVNHGHYGQPIYLDNINLAFPTPTLVSNNSPSVCISSTYTFNNTSLASANYTWNFQGGTPATSTATNPSVTYANPGTYTYNLLGVNGTSSATSTQTITVSSVPVLNTNGPINICAGVTATLTANGANSYSWNTGVSGPTIFVAASSNTAYVVTGIIGACNATATVALFVNAAPTISAPSHTVCAGNPNSVTLTASGANTYLWSNNAPTYSTSVPPANGVYTVIGTSSGCSTTKTVSIQVNQPTAIISYTNSSCTNTCSGIVTATASGGTAPYTYSVSGSPCTSLPCGNVCIGSNSLTVSDAFGCNFTQSFAIASSTIQSVVSSTNASCENCPDGVLSTSASGGGAPYTYAWLPSGGNSAIATGLSPGCYTVNVTDNTTCTKSFSACVDFITGLTNISQSSSLLIYPNPAWEQITIDYKGILFDYVVYNNLGQLITHGKNNQNTALIDLKEFAKGIYLIEVQTDNQITRKKLLVE